MMSFVPVTMTALMPTPTFRVTRSVRLLLVVVLALSGIAVTYAWGSVEIESAPDSVQRDYSFAGESIVGANVVLRNPDYWQVDYGLGITSGQSGDPTNRYLQSPAGDTLDYRITTVGGSYDLKDLPDNPSPNEILSGRLSGGSSVTESFEVRLPGGGFPPAGTYTDTVLLVAYERYNNDPNISEQRNLSITLTVLPSVSLVLVPLGGQFDTGSPSYTLNMGFVEPGDSQTVDLLVRANTGYMVTVESANAGSLQHVDPTDTSTVPYDFFVEENPVDLSSGPAQIATFSGVPPSEPWRYTLGVTIGDYGIASSGDYRDTLAITVTAR